MGSTVIIINIIILVVEKKDNDGEYNPDDDGTLCEINLLALIPRGRGRKKKRKTTKSRRRFPSFNVVLEEEVFLLLDNYYSLSILRHILVKFQLI